MRRRIRYLLILIVLVTIGTLVLRARWYGPSVKEGSYLLLDLHGSYGEGPPQDLLGSFLHRRERTLIEILTLIRKARVDERIKGVIVRVGALDIGWAKTQDIRDALVEFKNAGKPLVALFQQEVGGGNKEYYLASVADRVYLSPNVTAPLNGLEAQFVFLGGVWEKLDVQMDVEKIGAYKTAGDMIGYKEMTPAHREMANWLLDSLSDQFVDGLAHARGIDADAVRSIIDESPISPADYQAARLSNGTKYLEDLQAELGGDEAPLVRIDEYAQVPPSSLGLDVGPKIGVVFGVGAITMGESRTGVQGNMLGAQTVIKALDDAVQDSDVRAIVLRVDSPGGSALASDLVWRATQEARKKKPLIVSMSDVAGSGGYYIAAGASRIVAQPATLTGSIGVVMARPNIEGLLGRFGIHTETMGRGRYAALNDVTTPLTPEGREKLIESINVIYDVFVDRVARGRSLSPERVDEVGQGRVWTGAQARQIGLVDELGGFRAAIQAAKAAADIDPTTEVELVFYPRRKSMLERVSELLETRATAALPTLVRQILRTLPLPFESGTALTLMPHTVEVR